MGMQRVCIKCQEVHHHFAKCKKVTAPPAPPAAAPVTGGEAATAGLTPLTAGPSAPTLMPQDSSPAAPSNKAMEGGRKAPRVRRPAIGSSYGFQSRVPYSRASMNTTSKYESEK